jgi:hypothetical protein
MTSRSLICRLEVERPDPENRTFLHADPLRWTLDNRQQILRALFTLLRWNPQIRASAAERVPSKTRFKAWWDLVGAPLELAAMLATEAQAAAAEHGGELLRCAPDAVDFGAMFAGGEEEEEETSGMRELVLLLRERFGDRLFSATDLSTLMQPPPVVASFAGSQAEDERLARVEATQAIRAALEGATGKSLPPVMTPRLGGKRLQMVVDRPVGLGGGTIGTLIRHADHNANAYRVKITREAGP